jgi:hypothetical protein
MPKTELAVAIFGWLLICGGLVGFLYFQTIFETTVHPLLGSREISGGYVIHVPNIGLLQECVKGVIVSAVALVFGSVLFLSRPDRDNGQPRRLPAGAMLRGCLVAGLTAALTLVVIKDHNQVEHTKATRTAVIAADRHHAADVRAADERQRAADVISEANREIAHKAARERDVAARLALLKQSMAGGKLDSVMMKKQLRRFISANSDTAAANEAQRLLDGMK